MDQLRNYAKTIHPSYFLGSNLDLKSRKNANIIEYTQQAATWVRAQPYNYKALINIAGLVQILSERDSNPPLLGKEITEKFFSKTETPTLLIRSLDPGTIPTDEMEKSILREFFIGCHTNFLREFIPNFIFIYAQLPDPLSTRLMIEFVPGYSLDDYLKLACEPTHVIQIFSQLILALAFANLKLGFVCSDLQFVIRPIPYSTIRYPYTAEKNIYVQSNCVVQFIDFVNSSTYSTLFFNKDYSDLFFKDLNGKNRVGDSYAQDQFENWLVDVINYFSQSCGNLNTWVNMSNIDKLKTNLYEFFVNGYNSELERKKYQNEKSSILDTIFIGTPQEFSKRKMAGLFECHNDCKSFLDNGAITVK